MRKPVNVAGLAESLGQPYETMRCQVQRLVRAGVCMRVDGGVIVPGAVLENPAAMRAMLANVTHVRRLVRDLGSLGVSLRSELQPTVAAPRRAVG
jgi:hypothetical protein